MSVGEPDLTALARAVSAGERPIKAFYAAFAKAVVHARRPERPGVFVTDTESQGRWTVAFTSLDRLAAYAGECDYISMPGSIFLELVPPGVGVMVDPDDDHRLPHAVGRGERVGVRPERSAERAAHGRSHLTVRPAAE